MAVPWTAHFMLEQTLLRRPTVPADELAILAQTPDPEQALTAGEDRALLMAALDTLSERERAAIVLRDMEGRTSSEVAQILGSSETTVRSQISSGRVKMRNFILKKLRRRE